MASITKSSGTLFPLISQMKDQNQGVVEPKLKRTVGQRQDVRTGDGLTTIMSKVWGLLKKQDDYNKAFTKEINSQVKFRKESKDLMKKNTDVVLKALNALNKDSTKILSKILKAEDRSLKEQQKVLEQQKTAAELKNDFAKEDKRESYGIEEKRHQEIVELLKKMAGDGEGKDGKTKKEKKSIFEKLFEGMAKSFKNLLTDSLTSILGKTIGSFLSGIALSIPKLLASGVRLALAHPLGLIATAMVGIDGYFSGLTNKHAEEKMKSTQDSQLDAAKKGDLAELEKLAKSQVTQEMMTGKFDKNGKVSDIKELMKSKLEASGNKEALEKFYQANPNMRSSQTSTQQFPSTVNVKPGAESAGPAEQGTEALKENLGSKIGGFNRITAVKDQYHKENAAHSKHNEGLAVDFTVKEKTPEAYAAAATQVREHLRSTGLKDGGTNPDFKVIDEYKSGTASHIHVQFRDKTAANQYLASSGKADTTQMASIQSPADATANQTATPAPEEQTKPKFLNDIIKDFAKMAQSEFDASESMFKLEGAGQTPSTNFNKTTPENIKLNAESKNQNKTPAASAIITNNIASNGGGNSGSSGVPLTARSNHSTLERAQTGMLATM